MLAIVLLKTTLEAATCTQWASSQGSGSTCSKETPCTIGTFLSTHAKPGATVCLADGVYKGDTQMLNFTPAHNGKEGQPITVQAENDGKALIDGQFGRRPFDCNGSYITIQGIDFSDGNDTTVVLRGSHCIAQRFVAWSTQYNDGIENIIDIGGSYNLVEDFGAFGYARKTLAMGARGGNGPNTARRGWVEFNGSMPGSAQGNPTNPAEIGYGQNNVTMENIFARRNIFSQATEPEAPFMVFSTHGSALLGSIAYATIQDHIEPNITMLDVYPDAGSHAGSGHVTSNTLLRDIIIFADNIHPNIVGYTIRGGSGSTGNIARNIIAITPKGVGTCTGSGWECTNMIKGSNLTAALGEKTLVETAPGVCKRVVNRQVTEESLWPFPMRQRIIDALFYARQPTGPVTYHAAKLLDEIATACGILPQPPIVPPITPQPPTVHQPLNCVGELGAEGKIQLKCLPAVTRGYEIP
jgi:hypothetical protein